MLQVEQPNRPKRIQAPLRLGCVVFLETIPGKSSTDAPSSIFSNNARTGTRVPRKTHAPLTRWGSRSTAEHCDQSSMANNSQDNVYMPKIVFALKQGYEEKVRSAPNRARTYSARPSPCFPTQPFGGVPPASWAGVVVRRGRSFGDP